MLRVPSIIRKWSRYHIILNHCQWTGIGCDETGNVQHINGWLLDINSNSLWLQNLNLTAFSSLISLDLHRMRLTGSIPKEVALSQSLLVLTCPIILFMLVKLYKLNLRSNQIGGLGTLELSCNLLNGSITSQAGCVSDLNLSHNFLQGEVPVLFVENQRLESLDLSYNNFTGIIEATQDFDIRYCIGTGAYGSVYRAQLPSGKVVALKKLHQLESQNPSFDKSFRKSFIETWSSFMVFVFTIDFDTARPLDPDSSNQTLQVGTYGYLAQSLPIP
ncbi:hypothetical protein PIB30_078714 [Stylosanthes scabra]|uniref:non-specific serine/threonine protein kinase n=1 Tax=Stylosanthes scabra TaxID=79078 RepID=A0ABU6SS54_9FABA|nr:hypothetical protein [Stylosanthes scabra]